jgi:hypothetical protein
MLGSNDVRDRYKCWSPRELEPGDILFLLQQVSENPSQDSKKFTADKEARLKAKLDFFTISFFKFSFFFLQY